jgi:hypothetical protein
VALPELPEDRATRATLHRLAAHVLARRRHDLVGRFGLALSPSGLATPAAGPEHEVVRTAGRWLHHDRGGVPTRTAALDLASSSLLDAAAFVGVALGDGFSVGRDTPPLGDVHAPLRLHDGHARAVAGWLAWTWDVLDDVVASLGAGARPSTTQLWPEHFDAACELTAAPGVRVAVGGSPGDAGHEAPYLYVSLGEVPKPTGDPYWNAPFGAFLPAADLRGVAHPEAEAVAFLAHGLERLAAATP